MFCMLNVLCGGNLTSLGPYLFSFTNCSSGCVSHFASTETAALIIHITSRVIFGIANHSQRSSKNIQGQLNTWMRGRPLGAQNSPPSFDRNYILFAAVFSILLLSAHIKPFRHALLNCYFCSSLFWNTHSAILKIVTHFCHFFRKEGHCSSKTDSHRSLQNAKLLNTFTQW